MTNPDIDDPISSNYEQFQDLTSKRLLVDASDETISEFTIKLRTDLQGRGETMVSVGIGSEEDDGDGLTGGDADKAQATLEAIANRLDCQLSLLRVKTLSDQRETRDFLLRRRLEDESDFCEVRVAVVGNVDAGKSTLLGVLTHNCLDNGRGAARQKLFRHKHEIESGRTSSVGNEILGFDSTGKVSFISNYND